MATGKTALELRIITQFELSFAGDITAIAKTDRAGFSGLAREFGTFKTQFDPFLKGATGDLAELVLPGLATGLAVRTKTFGHPGAFFTGNAANCDFHGSCSLTRPTPGNLYANSSNFSDRVQRYILLTFSLDPDTVPIYQTLLSTRSLQYFSRAIEMRHSYIIGEYKGQIGVS
jgi:hypothetical protein